MTDDRHPKKKRRHHEDDGYFGWPPGYDVVHFLDADGRRMSHEEWLAYIEENPPEVIGSGIYEDPYRLPGTEPHQ